MSTSWDHRAGRCPERTARSLCRLSQHRPSQPTPALNEEAKNVPPMYRLKAETLELQLEKEGSGPLQTDSGPEMFDLIWTFGVFA